MTIQSYDVMPVQCVCGLLTFSPTIRNGAPLCQSCQRDQAVEAMPAGFRRMTGEESDAVDGTQSILVLDTVEGRVTRWHPESFSQWGWKVVQKDHGEIVDSLRLSADDADLTDRQGLEAEGGRYVAVVPIDADDLAPLLRQSLYALEAIDVLNEVRESRGLKLL